MIFKRFTGLLWASLWSLSGSWEVLGYPLGVLGRLLGVLESPWWSLGVALGLPGGPGGSSGGPRGSLGRGQKEPKTQKVLSERLGGVQGGPWGDFDRGVVLGSSPGVANVDISLVLVMFLQGRCFRCLFCDFSM